MCPLAYTRQDCTIFMNRQQYKDFVIKYEGVWGSENRTKMSIGEGGVTLRAVVKLTVPKLTPACLEINFVIHMKHTGL